MSTLKKTKNSFDGKVWNTVVLCFTQYLDGAFLYIIWEHILRLLMFLMLIFLWRSLPVTELAAEQLLLNKLLTYTWLSFFFREQLYIVTPATSSLWEGSIIKYYLRPIPVLMSLILETVGRKWLSFFLFFSIPLLVLALFLKIQVLPESLSIGLFFAVSLFFSVLIGFAIDLIFASIAIFLKNGCWAALQIRSAVTSLLSGAVIPFRLMPTSLSKVLTLLPFGALANAPLSIYIGEADTFFLLTIQFFWLIVCWIIAIQLWGKAQERMFSFGG